MKHTIKIWAALFILFSNLNNSIGSSPVAVQKNKQVIDTTYVTQTGCMVSRFRIYSPSMDREIKVAVVLPPAYQTDKLKNFPILYTLHGKGAPYNTYAEMTKLQNEIKSKPFIYTCFDGDDYSMYIDSKYPIKTSRQASDTTKRKSLFTTFFF